MKTTRVIELMNEYGIEESDVQKLTETLENCNYIIIDKETRYFFGNQSTLRYNLDWYKSNGYDVFTTLKGFKKWLNENHNALMVLSSVRFVQARVSRFVQQIENGSFSFTPKIIGDKPCEK